MFVMQPAVNMELHNFPLSTCGAIIITVLSRASAHPPISTAVWFLEVVCLTANHTKFLCNDSQFVCR